MAYRRISKSNAAQVAQQRSVQTYADRFMKLTSVKYVAIYVEPKDAFHVGSNEDIPDSQWGEVAQ
jgi:hypothetical protein